MNGAYFLGNTVNAFFRRYDFCGGIDNEVYYKLLLYRFFVADYIFSRSGQAGIVVVYIASHRRSAYPDHFALTISANKFAG